MKRQGKNILAMVSMLSIGLFSTVQAANEGSYRTFPIRIEKNPVVSSITPELTTPITKDKVAFNIINHTGRALYFAGTEKEYVPVVSNTTVLADYTPGHEYQVVDENGKTVASWTLGDKIVTASAASASSEQFAAWEQTLQSVIANQKVNYVEGPAKAEPSYEAQSKPSTRTSQGEIIRGYW